MFVSSELCFCIWSRGFLTSEPYSFWSRRYHPKGKLALAFTYQKKSFHDRAFKWNNIIYFLSQINEVWKLMSLICLVLCLHKVIFCLLWLMYEKNGGRPPLSYQSFLKLAGQPSWASSPLSTTISSLPPVGDVGTCEISNVPTVQELGYEEIGQVWSCQVCLASTTSKKSSCKEFCFAGWIDSF